MTTRQERSRHGGADEAGRSGEQRWVGQTAGSWGGAFL
jgi:hypothetical protein